jgi:hypothetical protein
MVGLKNQNFKTIPLAWRFSLIDSFAELLAKGFISMKFICKLKDSKLNNNIYGPFQVYSASGWIISRSDSAKGCLSLETC